MLTSRTGIEFIDLKQEHWDLNHWVRGACLYGVMPANGLLYVPPHSCLCFSAAMYKGLNAFAAERTGRPGDGFLDHLVRFVPAASLKPPLRWAHPDTSVAHGSDASGERRPGTVGGIPLTLNAKETEGKPPQPRFFMEGGQQVPLQLSDSGKPAAKSVPLYDSGIPERGDSADIRGRASWSDGYWTLELSRALRTPSNRDVRLDTSEKSYSFGLAVWDGAAGDRHQVVTIVKLRFEPMKE